MAFAKFRLGQVVITPGANAVLAREDILAALNRHITGDWGDMPDGDKELNDVALYSGDRLMSSYKSGDIKFYIITEYDRSSTTILLPDEY